MTEASLSAFLLNKFVQHTNIQSEEKRFSLITKRTLEIVFKIVLVASAVFEIIICSILFPLAFSTRLFASKFFFDLTARLRSSVNVVFVAMKIFIQTNTQQLKTFSKFLWKKPEDERINGLIAPAQKKTRAPTTFIKNYKFITASVVGVISVMALYYGFSSNVNCLRDTSDFSDSLSGMKISTVKKFTELVVCKISLFGNVPFFFSQSLPKEGTKLGQLTNSCFTMSVEKAKVGVFSTPNAHEFSEGNLTFNQSLPFSEEFRLFEKMPYASLKKFISMTKYLCLIGFSVRAYKAFNFQKSQKTTNSVVNQLKFQEQDLEKNCEGLEEKVFDVKKIRHEDKKRLFNYFFQTFMEDKAPIFSKCVFSKVAAYFNKNIKRFGEEDIYRSDARKIVREYYLSQRKSGCSQLCKNNTLIEKRAKEASLDRILS